MYRNTKHKGIDPKINDPDSTIYEALHLDEKTTMFSDLCITYAERIQAIDKFITKARKWVECNADKDDESYDINGMEEKIRIATAEQFLLREKFETHSELIRSEIHHRNAQKNRTDFTADSINSRATSIPIPNFQNQGSSIPLPNLQNQRLSIPTQNFQNQGTLTPNINFQNPEIYEPRRDNSSHPRQACSNRNQDGKRRIKGTKRAKGKLKGKNISILLAVLIGIYGVSSHVPKFIENFKNNETALPNVTIETSGDLQSNYGGISNVDNIGIQQPIIIQKEKTKADIFSNLSEESNIKNAIRYVMRQYVGMNCSDKKIGEILNDNFYIPKLGFSVEGGLACYTWLLEGLTKGMIADVYGVSYKDISFKCNEGDMFVLLYKNQEQPLAKTVKKKNKDGSIRYTGSSTYDDIGSKLGGIIDRFTANKKLFANFNGGGPNIIEYDNINRAHSAYSDTKKIIEELFKQIEQGYNLDFSNGVLGGSMILQTEHSYATPNRNTGIDR